MKRQNLRRCEFGATMAEYAIALPVFVLLLLLTFCFLRLAYIRLSLQFATTELARRAAILPIADNPVTALADTTALRDRFKSRMHDFGFQLNPVVDRITICPDEIFGSASCVPGTDKIIRGVPNQLITYQVTVSVNLFLPRNGRWNFSRGNINVRAMVLAKNEPPV